jgi:hypothetical protein
VLVADRLVDAVRRRRGWRHQNVWLAPVALAALAFALTTFQLLFLATSSRLTLSKADAIATFLHQQPEAVGARPVVITDHPLFMNMASGLPMLALPAQSADVVLQLARDQGATLVLVTEHRGPYPAAFRSGPLASCFIERPLPSDVPGESTFFEIAQACR